jgi:parvulin-like peptidyl-prolyl isomerase
VRQDLIRTKAAELSRQRAGEIANALKSANDFTAAAKAQGLDPKTTDMIMRGATLPDIGASPEVDKVAFSLPKGAVSNPIATSDGTVIVKVVDREEVTPDKFRQAKDQFRAELLNERRARFFTAYMTKAKDKMKIEVKNDVLRRVTAAVRT